MSASYVSDKLIKSLPLYGQYRSYIEDKIELNLASSQLKKFSKISEDLTNKIENGATISTNGKIRKLTSEELEILQRQISTIESKIKEAKDVVERQKMTGMLYLGGTIIKTGLEYIAPGSGFLVYPLVAAADGVNEWTHTRATNSLPLATTITVGIATTYFGTELSTCLMSLASLARSWVV